MRFPHTTLREVAVPTCTVEETYEPCPCTVSPAGIVAAAVVRTPTTECVGCNGTGYRCTKRVCRSIPFDEQAALAQVKTLTATIHKAAKTIEQAAHLLRDAGKGREAAETMNAAKALRATVDG